MLQRRRANSDRGSITPLVLGMTLCLLVLAAGVIAAGSAFLGGQRVQRICDGAANAAANSAPSSIARSDPSVTAAALSAAYGYASIRGNDITISINLIDGVVRARCSADVPITFGGVVGYPTLNRTVDSVGEPEYTVG